MTYDSKKDTLKHIAYVRQYLGRARNNLRLRAKNHDASALLEPEKSFYDQYRPLLNSLEYGSEAYMDALEEFKPAITHHYRKNRHHPEHHENGIDDMTLLDILEMVVDWRAAIDRKGTDEKVLDGFDRTVERFKISPQLANVIRNTVEELELV